MYDIPTYLLPAHSAEEVSAAPFLLPPRDVPFTGSDRLHREKIAGNLVTGADCLYSLRDEDAKLAYHLPVDLQEIPGKRQSESASPQGKEPRSKRNTREIQQGKVEPQEGQSGIQPPEGRALGSRYIGERPGQKQSLLAALAERKTRFYIAVEMPGRRAETMENAIAAASSAFPSQLVKTITCDRGTEFANWRHIEERLHCDVYFADPYCAWQKGANEKLNGLLQEFYPKVRNLSRVAPATLK